MDYCFIWPLLYCFPSTIWFTLLAIKKSIMGYCLVDLWIFFHLSLIDKLTGRKCSMRWFFLISLAFLIGMYRKDKVVYLISSLIHLHFWNTIENLELLLLWWIIYHYTEYNFQPSHIETNLVLRFWVVLFSVWSNRKAKCTVYLLGTIYCAT